MTVAQYILVLIAAVPAVVIWVMFRTAFRAWVRSNMSGAGVSLPDLVRLRFRGAELDSIVNARIMVSKAGLNTPVGNFVNHQRNGGNVLNLAKGLVGCHIGKLSSTFDELAAMDRKGIDLTQFIGEQLKATSSEHHAGGYFVKPQTAPRKPSA